MADVAIGQRPGYYIPTPKASLPGVALICLTMLCRYVRHIPKSLAGLWLRLLDLGMHSLPVLNPVSSDIVVLQVRCLPDDMSMLCSWTDHLYLDMTVVNLPSGPEAHKMKTIPCYLSFYARPMDFQYTFKSRKKTTSAPLQALLPSSHTNSVGNVARHPLLWNHAQ